MASPVAVNRGGSRVQSVMMTESEIRQRYAGRWVLVRYHRLGDDLEVIDGEVLVDAGTKEDIYKALLQVEAGGNATVLYCGDWPTDVAVMFCARRLR